jgi:hypothetical protein
MATHPLGPTFGDELLAAGADLRVTWTADGELTFDAALSPAQIAAIQAVYDAHNATDPAKLLAQHEAQRVAEYDARTADMFRAFGLVLATYLTAITNRLNAQGASPTQVFSTPLPIKTPAQFRDDVLAQYRTLRND